MPNFRGTAKFDDNSVVWMVGHSSMGKLTRAIREFAINEPESIDLQLNNQESMMFSPLGIDRTLLLQGDVRLTHGTSLDTMAKASKLLEREFELDSEDDYVRYFMKSKYTYYAILQSAYHISTIDCALRIVLDDLSHPKVVVIDFIRTRKKRKGKGLASQLIEYILSGCRYSNVFVTSTAEATGFWKKFGFEENKDEDIDYLLNEFGDCTLMGLSSNTPFELPSDYSGSEETECTDTEDESSSSSSSDASEDSSETESSQEESSTYSDSSESSSDGR